MKQMSEWPKPDPLTGRNVCMSCWNGIHFKRVYRFANPDQFETVSACSGECDCGHINAEQIQAQERSTAKDHRKAKRELEESLLERSPLQAVNPQFDRVPKVRKVHA